MPTKLGRPKDRCLRTITFRFKESEWADLRRCALVSGLTMSDWLREQIKRYKRNAKARGEWTDAIEREEYEAED